MCTEKLEEFYDSPNSRGLEPNLCYLWGMLVQSVTVYKSLSFLFSVEKSRVKSKVLQSK